MSNFDHEVDIVRWLVSLLIVVAVQCFGVAVAADMDPGPYRNLPPCRVTTELDHDEIVAGDVALMTVSGSPGAVPTSGTITTPWGTVSMLFRGRGLSAWVPIPLGATVGRHALSVSVLMDDGRRSTITVPVTVVLRDAPVQHLRTTSSMVALTTDSQRIARDRALIRSAYQDTSRRNLWTGPFLTPTLGRVSTEFGVSRLTNGRLSGYHYGIDIAAPTGTPVLASNSGRVVLADDLLLQGQTVIIDHGRGLHSLYYHLSSILVSTGQVVNRGDLIGEVGSTGYSTGPHLHWGLTANSVPIDPLPFVSGTRSPTPPLRLLSDRH